MPRTPHVTERSRVAMPETGIGYLPDVGGTWLLPRAPGELGTYLGLTGAQIGAADAILCGMADVFVPSASLPDLIAALAGARTHAALARFAQNPGEAPLEAHRAVIDRCFAFDMMDEIVSALDADGSGFAAETKEVLLTKAPTSLVLTLCLLRLGRAAPTLEACLEREFHASLAVLEEGDFREGIRAVVIDKDKSPRWNPPRLDQSRSRPDRAGWRRGRSRCFRRIARGRCEVNTNSPPAGRGLSLHCRGRSEAAAGGGACRTRLLLGAPSPPLRASPPLPGTAGANGSRGGRGGRPDQ